MCGPRLEACIIDVGGEEVDAGSTSLPNVGKMSQRACRRIFARLAPSAVHRGIHIEWHIVNASRCLRQVFHVAGIVPGHEFLVGIVVGAKHLCPCAFFLAVQRFEQCWRHKLSIGFLSQRRVVASRFQHANLVLNLHHHNHLALWVLLSDVLHQGGESLQVGLQHVVAETGGNLQWLALRRHRSWEAFHIAFEPRWCIARHRIFPYAEPERHDFQSLLPGYINGAVYECEVPVSLHRLHQFPINGNQHRVQPQRFHAG